MPYKNITDYCNEPDQRLVEGLDPFERARNEGLTEIGTSTIIANNFVEPNVSPDPNLEEAEDCIEPHEDLNTPNAEGTFMSTRNPDQENVRSADSSSRQRQGIIDKHLRNFAFQAKAICTPSIRTSVLNMAQNFDDDTYEETTSVNNIGERVAQYKVKLNFAHTLRAIVEKHSDIAKDCLLRSPEMLTSVLEKLAILDAELVKVDVKWLKNCHNELKVAVDHVKRYKSLVLSKRRNIEAIESKKTGLMKLKSQIESLEFQISSLNDENESLDGELRRAKFSCEHLQLNSIMDSLL
ncbi:Phospholipase-like [Trema orientale]|uniref:Phospholipase-like n=1 Tax=Trema orientale TaxID=63057 RepID=A0A2P5CBV6_TREOI|nr:Phospholipase-like [Trema orientale]